MYKMNRFHWHLTEDQLGAGGLGRGPGGKGGGGAALGGL